MHNVWLLVYYSWSKKNRLPAKCKISPRNSKLSTAILWNFLFFFNPDAAFGWITPIKITAITYFKTTVVCLSFYFIFSALSLFWKINITIGRRDRQNLNWFKIFYFSHISRSRSFETNDKISITSAVISGYQRQ